VTVLAGVVLIASENRCLAMNLQFGTEGAMQVTVSIMNITERLAK
jgi:hypothetical protein